MHVVTRTKHWLSFLWRENFSHCCDDSNSFGVNCTLNDHTNCLWSWEKRREEQNTNSSYRAYRITTISWQNVCFVSFFFFFFSSDQLWALCWLPFTAHMHRFYATYNHLFDASADFSYDFRHKEVTMESMMATATHYIPFHFGDSPTIQSTIRFLLLLSVTTSETNTPAEIILKQ